MNPPIPGLRPLFNKSNSTVRVELLVPAGAEVCVTDEVASQLPSAFAPVRETAEIEGVEDEGVEDERPDGAEPGVRADDDTSGLPPAIEKPAPKRGRK